MHFVNIGDADKAQPRFHECGLEIEFVAGLAGPDIERARADQDGTAARCRTVHAFGADRESEAGLGERAAVQYVGQQLRAGVGKGREAGGALVTARGICRKKGPRLELEILAGVPTV